MGTPPPGSKGGARVAKATRRGTWRVEGCASVLSPPKVPPLKTTQGTIPPQLNPLPQPRDGLVPIGERLQQQAALLGGLFTRAGAVTLGHDRRNAFQVLQPFGDERSQLQVLRERQVD